MRHMAEGQTATQMRDIFFWSIFYDNQSIGRCIWPHCALPVHVALLGSAVCKAMASADINYAVHHSGDKWRLVVDDIDYAVHDRARGAQLEDWAIGTIER
eukprot:4234485-Prymnesium_polylepis.1